MYAFLYGDFSHNLELLARLAVMQYFGFACVQSLTHKMSCTMSVPCQTIYFCHEIDNCFSLYFEG